MKGNNKDQKAILNKMGIKQLNEMQSEAITTIASNPEVILLSPTGSGKTLAFLLPIIAELDPIIDQVQTLILVPSRELAIQIEQVTREMGSGFKVNAVYGGRSGSKDKLELKHAPAILIGTPGRIADHFRRETIDTECIKTLVLDEFDKSLEIGFENEMKEILQTLTRVEKKVLTSATQKAEIPNFIELKDPKRLDFLSEESSSLTLKSVISPDKDKLQTLHQLLLQLGDQSGIVFCNFKDTIQFVSDYLSEKGIQHGCFYGGLEQVDRERALIKFRNGTHKILIATDLAARGIDVPEMDYIVHYQLPHKKEEFVHRNGRTARMNTNGTAYILQWEEETVPDFIDAPAIFELKDNASNPSMEWDTIYISGGRKDKISKGDIAGLFFKQGNLGKNELGIIELKQDCAFVAVPRKKAGAIAEQLNNSRLKSKKVRISVLK